ncbi:MAG: SurA N-terminal domain-containing protein [Alphaproteobacteria bacterium]
MLSFFRNIQHSIFIKIILALTALSFISLFGVSSYLSPNPEQDTVVAVGSTHISIGEIRKDLSQEVQRLSNMYGDNVDMEDAIKSGVLNSLIKKLVSRTVLDKTAEDLGISISDSSLRKETFNTPLFHGNNGSFDKAVFNQMLRLSGMSENQYFETLRGDIARKHLLSGAYANPEAPKILAENLYKYRKEKRIVDIINIKTSSINISAKPTAEELQDYYEKNKDNFMNPEYRSLTAIWLSPANIGAKIEVTDAEAKEIYDNEISAYTVPEERYILQMVFDDEETALKAQKMLNDKKDFLDVAKELANQSKEDSELGWITTETLLAEATEPVFAAAKGEIVGPIKSQFGYHIMKVNDIKAKVVTQFKDVKDQIISNVKNERALDRLYDDARNLEDILGKGTSLEDAAKTGGYELITLKKIDDKGLSDKGSEIKSKIISPLFLEKAFELMDGEDSLLIETDNGMFVVRVDEVIAAQPKELKEIKNQILNLWQADKKIEAARDKAGKVLESLNSGELASDAARKFGLSYIVSPAFVRTETEKLPQTIVARSFILNKGESALVTVDNDFAVITLKNVIEADPAKDTKGVEEIAQTIGSNIAEDLGSALISAFSQQYSIKIKQDKIDETF